MLSTELRGRMIGMNVKTLPSSFWLFCDSFFLKVELVPLEFLSLSTDIFLPRPETPVLWPPHAKSWLIGKDSDAERDWGQEEKGTTEDEMARWHHWLDGHESEWSPGVGDGQGGLACCDSWGRKESDTTERLIWSDLNHHLPPPFGICPETKQQQQKKPRKLSTLYFLELKLYVSTSHWKKIQIQE